jgi:hypothetical protein
VRSVAFLVSLVLLALIPAMAGADGSGVSFQTPSKRIGCLYSHRSGEAAALRCDVVDVVNPKAKPKSCELDYGSAFGLGPTGKGRWLCVGDTVLDPKAKVLAYGRTRTLGPFTCVSRTTGLRCATAAGHGFEISRTTQRVF